MRKTPTPKSSGKVRAGPPMAGKRTYGKRVAGKVPKVTQKARKDIVSENLHHTWPNFESRNWRGKGAREGAGPGQNRKLRHPCGRRARASPRTHFAPIPQHATFLMDFL